MEEKILETVSIRRTVHEDAALLAHLSYLTFEETFAHLNSSENMQEYFSKNCTTDALAEELKDAFSTFLIADWNAEPVGFAKLRWSEIPRELAELNVIEIQRLYVLKKMIGKKVGRALIEACFEIARSRNADTVWLGVWENNTRAISFYKKCGFEVFGSHAFELGNDKQTDLLMKKIL